MLVKLDYDGVRGGECEAEVQLYDGKFAGDGRRARDRTLHARSAMPLYCKNVRKRKLV